MAHITFVVSLRSQFAVFERLDEPKIVNEILLIPRVERNEFVLTNNRIVDSNRELRIRSNDSNRRNDAESLCSTRFHIQLNALHICIQIDDRPPTSFQIKSHGSIALSLYFCFSFSKSLLSTCHLLTRIVWESDRISAIPIASNLFVTWFRFAVHSFDLIFVCLRYLDFLNQVRPTDPLTFRFSSHYRSLFDS